MRLVVTGGSGFIGSNFIHTMFHLRGAISCPDLRKHELEISKEELEILNIDNLTYASDERNLAGIDEIEGYNFLEIDIANRTAVERAFEEFRPDYVVHFAAESHVDRSIESGDIFVRTNVLGTQVLLDVSRNYGVKKFVHVSTDEVYGSIEVGSFTEEDKIVASSPYSASKAGSDLLALAHHITYDFPVVITRCTNNYGPRQHKEKLLPKIVEMAGDGQEIPIFGDGLNVRDWLYVKDHCLAILRVLEEGAPGSVWNIAGRDEKTNLEVVERVLSSLGAPPDLFKFVNDRPGHDRRYSLDDSKLRGLGWKPLIEFEEGLAHTIDWHRESSE